MTARLIAFAMVTAFGAASFSPPLLAAPGDFRECAGDILETSGRGSISFKELAASASKADYIVFGERHGIKDQSIASACILPALASSGRPVALVMEMLSSDDDPVIERYRTENPETPAGLGVALKWWTRGWPPFDNWLPLIERAFSLRIPIKGGDIPGKKASNIKVSRAEANQLAHRLGDANGEIFASWKRAMKAAHCGLISDEQAAEKADEQIRRDVSMADAAQRAAHPNSRILLQVGRGHSRKDRALYAALTRSGDAVLTIGAFAKDEPITEADRRHYDIIVIAGTADRNDPCSMMGTTAKTGERPVQ